MCGNQRVYWVLFALHAVSIGGSAQSIQANGTAPVDGEVTDGRVVRTRSQAPYLALTDNLSEVVNLFPEPFRGLDVDGLGRVWAVNPHASTVVRFAPLTPQAELVVPTGLNPVSVALVEQKGVLDVLVVCAGTHAVFLHDGGDGHVKDVVKVDSEPADIVVDSANGWAFVSCRGANTIVQLDLDTFEIVARFVLPGGERPGPLYLDEGLPGDPTDQLVFVAATVTGNNSIPVGFPVGAGMGSIRDLDLFPCCELPDEDIHRIDPFAGTIEPAVTRAGSLLFDMARNPTTGDLWILSSDSKNKDAAVDSEPKLRGKLVINQLKIVPGVGRTGSVAANARIDLDDYDPGTVGAQYAPDRSINQARTLAFLDSPAASGASAFVASAVNDLILVLDAAGTRIGELNLPRGAQCYSLLVTDPDAGILHALCLGTMSLEVFQYSPLIADPIAQLELGLDPTPPQIRRGRDLFLDGSRSQDARSGCFSCHAGGGADQLGWRLSGDPLDEKDVMVTQSLLSIGDTFPYHWRGERALADFGKAFRGLLGTSAADDPTPDEVADLVAFMRSLQAPANPLQNARRIVDDGRNPSAPNGMVGSATRGQVTFHTIPSFNGSTCSQCHALPSGSDGNTFSEIGSLAPRVSQLEVTHLRQLQNKGAATLELDFGSGPIRFNASGYGFGHAGLLPSLFHFVFDVPVFFSLTEQQRVDVVKFVEQFDQGIAPACHWAVFFDRNSSPHVQRRIEEILLAGAEDGWNDVALFGRRDTGSGLAAARWLYDATGGLFVPESDADPLLSWQQILAEIDAGDAEYAFVGLPPGNGPRFAIDFDNDGVKNGDEIEVPGQGGRGTHGVVHGRVRTDVDMPGMDLTPPELDGAPRLSFATARLAKYLIRFSEDVTYIVTYSTPGGPVRTATGDDFSRVGTLVLTHSEPSSPGLPPNVFDASIVLTDRAGNTAGPFDLPTFQSKHLGIREPPFPANTHVSAMEVIDATRTGATIDVEVAIRIASVRGAPDYLPAPGRMAFCTIAILDPVTELFVKSETFTSPTPSTFDFMDLLGVVGEYTIVPGPPWLLSALTDGGGETTVRFQQAGLSAGDILRIAVMGIVEPVPGPGPPIYDAFSLFQMQQPLLENVAVVEITF